MINISKLVTIGSLLLFGSNANDEVTDWASYELGLELKDFYETQSDVALCKMDCMYFRDDYLGFFDDECSICIPQEVNDGDGDISCHNKEYYEMSLDGYYSEMKEIIKWEHEIENIEESDYTVPNGYEAEKVYKVTVKLNTEYIYGRCEYKFCATEEFEILNGKIMSYVVKSIHLKSEICQPEGYETETTKAPTSWKKSTTTWAPKETTTDKPTGPGPLPPTGTPSWSPTTPSPTTPSPTTAEPTTAGPTEWPTKKPTTPWPTPRPTPKPTTPEPTTAEPTTAKPTTAEPTTSEPTRWPTKKPTTPWPTPRPTPNPTTSEPTPKPTTPYPTTTTAEPTTTTTTEIVTPEPIPPKTTREPTMWKKATPAPTPRKCNYNQGGESHGYVTGYENEQCEHGYICEKENEYVECGYNYCPGICIKEDEY